MEKIANLPGHLESAQLFDPRISAIVCSVVDSIVKPVFVSVVVEADDSPALTL